MKFGSFDVNVRLLFNYNKTKSMKKLILLASSFLFVSAVLQAQEIHEDVIDGTVVQVMITEDGDTIIMAQLEDVSVTSIRKFRNKQERRHYHRMRYYANRVYPYAVEAVKVFREIEATTKDMQKRSRKKYIKQLQKDLKDKFKDPLKKLTRTEGKVLIKMIERELECPVYSVVKELRGGFTAVYWQGMAKLYSINLKEGYNAKSDPVLEMILSSMDVSHEVANR